MHIYIYIYIYTYINIYIYIYTYKYIYSNWLIGLVGRVFANGPGDLGSIRGGVIPKTLKMVLDTSIHKTHRYKVHIKDKGERSRERSSTLSIVARSVLDMTQSDEEVPVIWRFEEGRDPLHCHYSQVHSGPVG